MNSRRQAYLRHGSILAVLGISLALRLYQLGTESLWIDEGYSLRDAVSKSWQFESRPLYYELLGWWMHLGQSEAWLRLPSVIFGVLTVLLMYVVGKRLFGHMPAILASLVTAISPMHINHSQEVRMYTLLTFMVVAGVLYFLKYIETGSLGRLAAVWILGILAFLVFPMSIFMFMVFSLYLLIDFRRHRKAAVRWLGTGAMAICAIGPMMPRLLELTKSFGDAWTWRLPKPGPIDLVWLVRDFSLWRIAAQHKTALLAGNVYAVVVLALVVFGVLRGLRYSSAQTRFALLWLLVPVLTTAIISNLMGNVWIPRYMIYASPGLYLLMALGLCSLATRRVLFSIALAGVLLLPLAKLAAYYPSSQRPEWRQAVENIERRLQPGDSIAVYRAGNQYVFDYYYEGRAPVIPLGAVGLSRSSFDGWTDTRIASLVSAVPASSRRVWFVFSYHEETGGLEFEDYVRRHYKVASLTYFKRIRIFEALPITGLTIATRK